MTPPLWPRQIAAAYIAGDIDEDGVRSACERLAADSAGEAGGYLDWVRYYVRAARSGRIGAFLSGYRENNACSQYAKSV